MKMILSFAAILFFCIPTFANNPSVVWGTYYYGANNGAITPFAVKYDGFGHVYMCGNTSNFGLGTVGTFQDSLLTPTGGFIAKFDTSGNRIWATYYSNVNLTDIACDDVGNIYVSGITQDSTSNWIATPGTHQPLHGGLFDAVLAKFDSTGNRVWATYYGGEGGDQGHSVSVSGLSVFLSGTTGSNTDIASPNAFQQTFGGGGADVFIARFDTTGNRVWGTYYGGSQTEGAGDNCADNSGNLYYVSGTSSTTNIATPGSHQPSIEPGGDGFLVKFDSAGNRLWATYYGGEAPDAFGAVALGGDGNLYVLGGTGSTFVDGSTYNISTPGCFQSQPAGKQDAFIVKFTPEGQRIWGTYYANIGKEIIYKHGLCSDALSNVYLVLAVDSPGFVTQLPVQQGFGGQGDAIIAKFDSSGAYQWGSYYGGSNNDMANGCTADNQGNVYFSGHTHSIDNIATPGSFLSANVNGYASGFLVRIHDSTALVTVKSVSSNERILIYPNPVTEILSIESSSAGSGFLYSVDGKELMSFSLNKGKNDIRMPQKLSSGLYLISCRLANGKSLNQTVFLSE